MIDQGWSVHAMALLTFCQTDYTPTERETPGLINNTLLNKNEKTNIMPATSMFTQHSQRTQEHRRVPSQYPLRLCMHVALVSVRRVSAVLF